MINGSFGAGRVVTLAAWLFGAALIILAGAPALAASSHACVTVRVDAPFRLPDGVLHPAGELTLCDSRAFSPVANSHAVYVNGSAVGMFQSRRRSTELGDVVAPEVVFEREPQGTLALIGYILPDAGRSVAFRLKGRSDTWQLARHDHREGGGSPSPVAAIIAAAGTH